MKDKDSITNVIEIINRFSFFAGPNLNVSKTKGIWLGPLKDLGLRKFCDITWTGNPIKCLGIYLGHKKEKCDFLNWNKKLDNIHNTLNLWKCRDLSIEGKILIIKTMIISKIVFPVTLLDIPEEFIRTLKEYVYDFIWGSKDKVKRTVLTNDKKNGGYSMIDIDTFCNAIKASWVVRL